MGDREFCPLHAQMSFSQWTVTTPLHQNEEFMFLSTKKNWCYMFFLYSLTGRVLKEMRHGVCETRSLGSRIYFQALLTSSAEKEKAWVLSETRHFKMFANTFWWKCSDNNLLSALSSLINGNLPIFQPIYLWPKALTPLFHYNQNLHCPYLPWPQPSIAVWRTLLLGQSLLLSNSLNCFSYMGDPYILRNCCCISTLFLHKLYLLWLSPVWQISQSMHWGKKDIIFASEADNFSYPWII